MSEIEEGLKRGKADRDLTDKDREHVKKRAAEDAAHEKKHKEPK